MLCNLEDGRGQMDSCTLLRKWLVAKYQYGVGLAKLCVSCRVQFTPISAQST